MEDTMINCTENTDIEVYINSTPAVLIYFSHEECNVCKVLKPKVITLLKNEFQKIKMMFCDTTKYPEKAAQKSIFTVPTILVFFEGKEFIRESRNISIDGLKKQIERPYSMMFE